MTRKELHQISETIAKLRAHFVSTERYTTIEEQFHLLLQKRRADIKAGRTTEARCIALIGGSGSGKTTAIERLCRLNAQSRKRSKTNTHEVVSLRVPSPATLKFVGQTILRSLGYDLRTDRQAWYIWDLVRFHARERGVLFLHLDEAQDLSARGTERERQAVVNMLKSLMQDPAWPVGFILSGTHELKGILNFDAQLGRRVYPIQLEPLDALNDGDDVRGLVQAYCRKSVLAAADTLSSADFTARLAHAAANEFGLVIELIIAAIEEALIAKQTQLTPRMFVDAFRRRSGCIDGLNPFLIEDFERIDPRAILSRLEVL
ncbi:MAG: TniB family NTP-binding protein [Ruegeria sp.]|uniref:TniB family NTP-binding protein n=1 Tax=Ruegeria sp. TaxID=1879320 RepID=UPI00349EB0A7